MLLAHSRTDEYEPKSFDLDSTAEMITRMSRNRPEHLTNGDTEWCLKITTLNVDSQCLSKLSNLDQLVNLKWASFAHNFIGKIEGLDCCSQLIELSLEDNCISKIEGLALLTALVRLNLAQNRLSSLDGSPLSQLCELQRLNVDNNHITVLDGLQYCSSLLELCAANNCVSGTRNAFCLKNLQNFTILDLHGNPVTETENYRLLIIFHLQTLQCLDGIGIEVAECNLARETFGGRLTQDFIADRIGHANFFQLLKADFSHMAIKQVDLGSTHCFHNLTSLNLEHNSLASFEGLTVLENLKVLCLNHNHIESVFPIKPKQTATVTGTKTPQLITTTLTEARNHVLTRLQVLHLGHNGITSIAHLQLQFPALQSLFLQANEIVTVDGLDGLTSLRELVLDRNKIRCLKSDSLSSQSKLVELHMEENRCRCLSVIVAWRSKCMSASPCLKLL
jgi:Leucine-rich repeat (LRR) protein